MPCAADRWKQSRGKKDEELIPLPSADSSALQHHGLECICSCSGFHILTFRVLGFPWCLRNVQTVSRHSGPEICGLFSKLMVIRSQRVTQTTYESHMSSRFTACVRAKKYSCRFFSRHVTFFYCLSHSVGLSQQDTLTHTTRTRLYVKPFRCDTVAGLGWRLCSPANHLCNSADL